MTRILLLDNYTIDALLMLTLSVAIPVLKALAETESLLVSWCDVRLLWSVRVEDVIGGGWGRMRYRIDPLFN